MLKYLCLLVAVAEVSPAHAALDAKGRQEVDVLLKRVEQSGCIFVRNDDPHPAKEAADHLRLKLAKAGDKLRTADDFIDYLATKSSWTGKPYTLRCAGRPDVQAGQWLKAELKQYRTGRAN
ncbi:DUF5329 domain-containing protein [Chitinivorax sp. B]|uniref:DUF5329 domain-containing protein n=1 Tax=Chitinivorax sp. B TaxID=2502235 RepID=UPI0010F7FFB8|nr:DUF5329 domain-containing protein [Chitinivorax sp. B]